MRRDIRELFKFTRGYSKIMAKKSDMIKEIVAFWDLYKHLFIRFKLDEKKFFRWFDSFQKYPDVRQVYKFMFTGPESLLALVIPAQVIYNKLSPRQWEQLPYLDPRHPVIVELQRSLTQVRLVWGRRPHGIPKAKKAARTDSRQPTHQTYAESWLVGNENGSG